MAPAVTDSKTRPSGSQNFPIECTNNATTNLNESCYAISCSTANQMGGCFINASQQFSPQQPHVVWPGGLPPELHPNMGVDGAALAANIMQSILIGANQYRQHFQNQNFDGFPRGMPVPPPQFMPGSGIPANPMPFGGSPVNHPFDPASQLPMGQGNFGQLPHMAGNRGQSPGFPNMQGYGRLPSPHGDGDQPPMQFNSGQFNQGNSSFRGRRPQQRGGRHSLGRGGGSRHSPGRGASGRHCK